MRTKLPALLLTLLVLLGVRMHATPAAQAGADGGAWIELVGKDLSGWKGDARFWSVKDGAIVGASSDSVPCDRTTYLVREGFEVEDFELVAEYRIVGGNSGIQFRSANPQGFEVAGPQADIEDGESWTGCLYEQDGRGVMTTRGLRTTFTTNRKHERRFAAADQVLAAVKRHDWNTYRIVAVGGTIVLELNGVRSCETIDADAARRVRGLLALQLHAGPGMEVAYRSIKVRKLGPDDAPRLAELDSGSIEPHISPGPLPEWIWTGPDAGQAEQAAFERRFVLPFAPRKARLLGGADNHLAAWINGVRVLVHDDWSAIGAADALERLVRGENTLVLCAGNDGGPAGAWCELVVEGDDGKRLRLVSDASFAAVRLAGATAWNDAAAAQVDLARSGPAHALGRMGVAPWGMVDDPDGATSDASVDQALDAGGIEVQPGFVLELVHRPDPAAQGSWVALCEAPGGLLYASDQYGALWRARMDARPFVVERVPAKVGGAHGLAWHDGALYCVVAEGGDGVRTGLWRIDDKDGDGMPETARLLRAFDGGGEHGPHGIVVGPDGLLWIVGGNHTALPECATSRVPRLWGEDNLTPVVEDPRGHANGIRAPGGWIVKTDAEGRSFELHSMGYRNAYDIAFDARGELYTWDSDMEWDVGAPWYRPVRIAQAVSGSDYGWRTGAGKWPASWIDTLPSTIDLGRGSPTGLVFGTGLKAPRRWQQALYACDWSFGTIWAVGVREQGAGSTATALPFVRGTPFPATDILVGSDGALWITTGGRRTRSGLYRVHWDGGGVEEPAAPVVSEALAARRALERLHSPSATWSEADRAAVAAALVSPDRFLAHAARIALEHAAPAEFDACARRLGAADGDLLVAALHRHPAEKRAWCFEQLNLLPGGSVEERRDWLRLVQLAIIRLAPLDDEIRAARERAEAMPWCGDERADRDLATLLAHFGGTRAIERLLARFDEATKQEDLLHIAYALSTTKGFEVDQSRRFLVRYGDLLPLMRGGESLQLYAERIRERFVAAIPPAQLASLADAIATRPRESTAVAAAAPAAFVKHWTREELGAAVNSRASITPVAAGRAAWARAGCGACHRIEDAGGSTGPDLTTLGSRFGQEDLFDALLEPSKTISDQYADTEVQTTEGDLLVGRVEGEADGLLRLVEVSGRKVEIPLAEIAVRRPWKLSRMPAGTLDTLDADGVAALVDYALGRSR